jgi:hypothetical protein
MRLPTAVAAALLLALGLAAPAAAGSTRTKADPAADFSAYETYRWRTAEGPTAPDLDRLVRAAADETLAGRGWRKVGVGEPADLELNYAAGMGDMLTAGLRVEADWWGSLWAVPAGESYTSAGIAFFLTDLEAGKMVWAGVRTQKTTNDQGPIVMRKRAPKYTRDILGRVPKE